MSGARPSATGGRAASESIPAGWRRADWLIVLGALVAGAAMALRSRWNCQTLTPSAITRTKLSMQPITAIPATISAAPRMVAFSSWRMPHLPPPYLGQIPAAPKGREGAGRR